MVRFVGSLLLLFFAQNSFAALEVFRNSLSSDASEWTFYYNEDTKWILEVVTLDEAGWPKLEKSTVFDNEKMARVALTAASAQKVRTRRLPDARKVLKGAAGQSLWQVTNEWTWEWEVKYSEWVKTELDRYWWLNHGLATDCADVAYSARWIFARINGLPMANRLGSGQWFTQDSVRADWANLPTAPEWHKDKKFLTALNYMLNFVFTHTLWNDSYPVAINDQSLIPGVHHLSLHGTSGHTQFVHRVGHRPEEIPVMTLNSTVPREKRELAEYLFQNDKADPAGAAFLRMRWPEVKNGSVGLADPSSMPFYSVEQFDANFIGAGRTAFWQEVYFRINPGADFNLIGETSAKQIAGMLQARVAVVEDGYRVCSINPCKEDSAEYEAWSTPSRDNRVRATISSFEAVQGFITRWDMLEPVFKTEVISQEGYSFTVAQLMMAFKQNLPTSDPNDDPVLRWGLHPRAVSEKVRRVLKTGIAERDKAINRAHNCRDESCKFGSSEFKRASTYSIDMKIWSVTSMLNTYCSHLSDPLCSDVKTRLRTISLNANGETKSLSQWIDDAAYFNSDPRLARDRRFAGYTKDVPHRKADSDRLALLSAFNKQIIFTGGGFFTVNGTDLVPWAVPTGEVPLALDSAEGWVWTTMGQFVLARKNPGDVPLRYLLPSMATAAYAHSGKLLASEGNVTHFLKIENGVIEESEQFVSSHMQFFEGGLVASINAQGSTFITDLVSGTVSEFKESVAQVIDLRRSGPDYFIKYGSSSNPNMLCKLIALDDSVADLTPTGSCINYVPDEGVGIFSVNGRAIKRTFAGGRITGEEDLGSLPGYYGERLVRTGGPTSPRYFCFGSSTLKEIIKPVGVLDVTSCNDRFVIEAVTLNDWRVRSRADGSVLLETVGYLDFAGPDMNEHYVTSGSWNMESVSALLDVDRPERFSILTDEQVWPTYYTKPAERTTGLVMMKGQGTIWLLD